jgi:phage gp45-like
MPTQPDQMITRTEIIETYDKDDQQKLQANGRYQERYGGQGPMGVPRVQSYGFTSHVPKGSHAYTMTPTGNPDHAAIIGLEHAQSRPRDLAEGEFKTYEKWGGFDHGKEDKWVRKVGTSTIESFRDGTVHINRGDAVAEIEAEEQERAARF